MAKSVREIEDKSDHYEDIIGTYLVKLSARQVDNSHSADAAMLHKVIGDLERISDHAVNLVDSAEELKNKNLSLSPAALSELKNLSAAVYEILDLSLKAFVNKDTKSAAEVEPLEQVIDSLKEQMRTSHILRLQQGSCSIETGFVWSDILTNLERTSDHCSNIAGCVIDAAENNLNIHESLRNMKTDDPYFKQQYSVYADKYLSVK